MVKTANIQSSEVILKHYSCHFMESVVNKIDALCWAFYVDGKTDRQE